MASKIGAEVVAVPVGPDLIHSAAPYQPSGHYEPMAYSTNTQFNQAVAVQINYQAQPVSAYGSATVIPMQVNAVPVQPMQIQPDNRAFFGPPMTSQQYSGGNDPVFNWAIDLFQCGDCCPCLYSWCCPACALGW
jgi:hypothetical protein